MMTRIMGGTGPPANGRREPRRHKGSCTSVKTNAELDAALETARKHPGAAYTEILLGCETLFPGLPPELLDTIYQTTPPKA
jgi:hypothetical protein